jgi:glucose-6-phosphate 1-epimerase
MVLRSADGAVAEVYLHGAHVASWRPASDCAERLFLSARSEFREGVAIRGGIPVIFPQFAAEGPLPRHGFARTSRWTLASHAQETGDHAVASFELFDSPVTRAIWPASFHATLTVRVGADRLSIELAVENVGADLFAFTAALHSYLRVESVRAVELAGLHGGRYRESIAPDLLRIDDDERLRVSGEVDRVYVGAPPRLALREQRRDLQVVSTDFPDVVVWNPGPEKAKALRDMEPGDWERMLCVEAAAVQQPIVLKSGRHWWASQTLLAIPRESQATRTT